jgi:methylphosphotriester-DNA--protein-cysteine methyltransferase
MIYHIDLEQTTAGEKVIRSLIRKREITLAGYTKKKIYGLLNCSSGKRIKVENRVFFKDEGEAVTNGYRPCGHCMKEKYAQWKRENKSVNASINSR